MHIAAPGPGLLLDERALLAALPLEHAHVLELGCGTARQTRLLLETGKFASITALETDPVQHARNLARGDVAGLTFGLGSAEETGCGTGVFDAAFLFKSLHHVPVHRLDDAFAEIHRVLAPRGLVYMCEPVCAGAYNAILALFHDEQAACQAAFDATVRAVDSGRYALLSQTFFSASVRHRDFAAFERTVVRAAHTRQHVPPQLLAQVRARFVAHMTDEGAVFEAPFRVDLLRRVP